MQIYLWQRNLGLDHAIEVMMIVVVLHLNTWFLLQVETAAIPHRVFCGIILGNGVEKSLPFLNQTDSTCERNVLEMVLGIFMLWKDKEMSENWITSCQQNLWSVNKNSASRISSLVGTSCKGKNNFNILKHNENKAKSLKSHFICSGVLLKYSEHAFSFGL